MGAGMKYVFAEAKALPREGGTQLLCVCKHVTAYQLKLLMHLACMFRTHRQSQT